MKIFKSFKSYNKKIIQILGITIYEEKYMKKDDYIRKFFYGIFVLKRNMDFKEYYMFGLKIYKKQVLLPSSMIMETIISNINRHLIAASIHKQTFLPYKNKHYMQDVVLVGAGKSLNNYIPIKNALHLGLNRVFKFSKIHFDYLFATNKTGLEGYEQGFIDYPNCDKFIGDENGSSYFQISESFLNKANAKRFINTSGLVNKKLACFIETQPLYASSTVSIQAMQFLLYTNPKRIYLVGIDCSVAKDGHFIGEISSIAKRQEDLINNDLKAINDWKNLKKFAQIYYPDTEIISINPVGLKGIFKEIYSMNDEYYVNKNGDLVELENI